MIENLEQDLRPIIDAVVFHSADAFTFAGRPSVAWMAAAPAAAQVPLAVQTLQSVLYAYCYMKRFAGTIDEQAHGAIGDDPSWIEALSSANASRDRWEEGWQVQQFLPTGQVQAYKGGATRAFWPGEFITRGSPGMAPQPGTPIAAFFPRESRNMQPGFYFIFGETAGDLQDEYSTVRYYWNIRRDGAAPLVRSLTGALNRYYVPFRFKIVNHPALLGRSDAAILYVSRRFYRIAAEVSMDTHGAVAESLDGAVPLFTRRLQKGLAFAEDPGTQESFGMSRCRLLAEGMWQAFQEGLSGTTERLERVRRHFETAGTSLQRAHLNFAAIDPYEFPQ
jgi:hypothetical protein